MSTSATKNSIQGGFSLLLTSSPTEAKQSLTVGNVEKTVTTNFETGERTMQEREISLEEDAEKAKKKLKKRLEREEKRHRLLQERMNETTKRVQERAEKLEKEAKTIREKTLRLLEKRMKRNAAIMESSEEDGTSSEDFSQEGVTMQFNDIVTEGNVDIGGKFESGRNVNMTFDNIVSKGNVNIDFVVKGRKKR